MTKQEKFSWWGLATLAVCCASLSAILWSTWPDKTQLDGHDPLLGGLFLLLLVFLCASSFARSSWRPEQPYADERERAIIAAGNTQSLAALALMNVLCGFVLGMDDGLLARIDGTWFRYLLLLQIGVAFLIGWGYRLVRFRLG